MILSAFYMGKKEVTKAEWDEVRDWGLANGYSDLPAADGKAADHPVHSISWYAMVKWCNARSEKDGLNPCYSLSGETYKTGEDEAVACNWAANGYRLPTEVEWEKAARGGLSGKLFPWGDTISRSQANYFGGSWNSYDLGPNGYNPAYVTESFPYTSPVGNFASNGYGLYDIIGNVEERCWDWYGNDYTGASKDPRGPSSGESRVHRGGAWGWDLSVNYYGYPYVVGYRRYSSPLDANFSIGFRVARSSKP